MLVGMLVGFVWLTPYIWEARPKTWWGWVFMVGSLVFGIWQILMKVKKPLIGKNTNHSAANTKNNPTSDVDSGSV